MANSERTFIAIKPDGVQRGLVGEIIKRFEQKGFRLVGLKFIQVSGSHASYFDSLVHSRMLQNSFCVCLVSCLDISMAGCLRIRKPLSD